MLSKIFVGENFGKVGEMIFICQTILTISLLNRENAV